MSSIGSQVKFFVRKRIDELKSNNNPAALRKELALLRRGVGKEPGEIPEIWNYFFEGCPEELLSNNSYPTAAEWAVSTSLCMYAFHQQGNSAQMDKPGEKFGFAVRKLVKDITDEEKVRRRFNRVATSKNIKECAYHLREVVSLLKDDGIPMDYTELAFDIYQFQFQESRKRVCLRWGQDFYKSVQNLTSEESEE